MPSLSDYLALQPSVPGNIDLDRRPLTHNPDDTISTLLSMSFQDGPGGRNSVRPGFLSKRGAVDQYRQTGKHLGMFDTPEEADAFAQFLHEMEARKYEDWDRRRYRPPGTQEGKAPIPQSILRLLSGDF